VLRDCPGCGVPLPSGARPACSGCGLVWDELSDFGWTHADVDAYDDFRWARGSHTTQPPLRIVRRARFAIAGCGALFLAAFSMLPLGLLYAIMLEAPAMSLGLILVALATFLLGVFCLVAAAQGPFELLVPERIESEDEALRLRVEGGWLFRRTNVLLQRSDIAGLALRDARGGDKEVWLIHTSGAALRVASATPPEEAEALHEKLVRWLSPRPRARIAAGTAEPPQAHEEDDEVEERAPGRAVRRL
jgi:hypothetical protein